MATTIAFFFFLVEFKDAFAATGINETINFQGKVANSNGTNVSNSDYDFIFRLYKVSSGGTAQWTGTWNSGSSQITVTDGVFQAALGTQSSLSSLDFNDDSWYLSVEFNGDGEMTPRIRFASVPFAFNAKTVSGLTVTNTTGTFTLTNAKTLTISNTLTFDGTDGTTFTFPSATDTVVGLAATQTLTNKTIGSTGLVFSGATIDLTTGTDEDLRLDANGAGGLILTDASITLSGFITDANGVLYSNTSGALTRVTETETGSLCLLSGAGASGAPTWGTCGGGTSYWNLSEGALSPTFASTLDFLVGGQATTSAMFAVLGINDDTPSASVSAIASGTGLSINYDGSLQTTRNNTLTLGGDTTGNIELSPLNGSGTVTINGTLAAKTGGTATITVAASDSSARNIAQADYVASGTDDDVTIETAIAALPATGGTVYLFSGTYSIGDAAGDGIDITDDNVTLTGAGRGTILQRAGDAAALDGVITLGDGNAGVVTSTGLVISNLAIDGIKATYTSINNHGIYLNQGITESRIDRVWISDNGADGINMVSSNGDDTSYITITNSQLSSNANDGIEVATGTYTHHITLANNNIYSNTSHGVHLNAVLHMSIDGNKITSNGIEGIYFTNGAKYVSVVNNNISSNSGAGIQLYDSNHTITGNTIYLNTLQGIEGEGTLTNTTISGNIITASSGSLSDGIELESASNVTITGNTINSAGQHGINIKSNNNNNSITGNTISGVGPSDDGIYLATSDNNIITGNRITDTSGSRYGINISDSGSSGNYIASNEISGAGFIQEVNDDGTGTTIQHRDQFVIAGSNNGKALLTLDQQNATFDILTASASGTTIFSLSNTGSFALGSAYDEGASGECLKSQGAGVIVQWTTCGGGGFSGEVDDSTNDALTFTTDDASPPTGVRSIFADDTNVLILNSVSGGTVGIEIDDTAEYSFSATALEFNSNTIAGLGTTLTASAGLTIGTGSNGNIILTPDGTGDTVVSGDADSNLQITFSAAPAVDMVVITNTGQGTTTSAVDGLSVDFTAATGGSGETNAGIHITITDSGDSGDTIAGLQITAGTAADGIQYGIGIDTITGGSGAEYGINIAAGWDRGLSIADATGNSILLASDDGDTASGITFGSTNAVEVYRSAAGELTITDGSSNSFVFDTVNGPAYLGTARPTKTITLSPEYAGATLTDYYGAGTDTSITGSMTSDTDTTQGTSIRNYYEWNSSETASQHFYTTAVRITLPADFSVWATSNALVINYITESATTTQSDLDVRVYNENDATIVASDVDNASTSWTTVVIDDSTLDDGASSEWDAAGETAVIYLRMGSQDDDNVHIGDIVLNYLAAF